MGQTNTSICEVLARSPVRSLVRSFARRRTFAGETAKVNQSSLFGLSHALVGLLDSSTQTSERDNLLLSTFWEAVVCARVIYINQWAPP